MGDTTVTVETEEPEEGSTEEITEDAPTDGAGTKATHAAIESKAHAEHSASEAQRAADEAKSRADGADWAAKSAQDSLAAIAQIGENVIAAVQGIPSAVAEALSRVTPAEEPAVTIESDEPISPATPPQRRRFKDFYYGNGRK